MKAKEHYFEGLQRLSRDDFEGAIEAFQSAIGEDDEFFLGYLGCSQALDKLGKVDEAILQAKKAVDIVPDEPLVHTSLSRLLQQKGLIAEAEGEMALSHRLQSRV